MKLKIYFPQFYRKISAASVIIGITLIIMNMLHSQFFDMNEETKLLQAIIYKPTESALHEKLAQYYLPINADAAQREYSLAEEFYQYSSTNSDNIAGAKSSPWQTWLNIVFARDKLLQEIKYWEKVQRTLPDYQYANLKLAVLYYQLGDKNKSNQYLQAVLTDDPTNATALELVEKLK